ncbi:uncharacterized protein LOC122851349 isoform X2 [Aphidius gifuensis]|uniref:uncharacterized protein LOC122851349 isoform X2 n=1 Tax=Aphidius gifuensis TaxID=684658 RepID=UPI001CDD5A0C|nr:uncharacterized protein LOC122851349 isoform X2 [Aphidius gifuensis]
MDKKLISDTTIKINDGIKSVGNNIEYNVSISASILSIANKSKIYQQFINFIVVLMAILFLILFTQLKREVLNLEAQITSTSVNLENLLLKYEHLSRTINRNNNNRKNNELNDYDDEDDTDNDDAYHSMMYMTDNINNNDADNSLSGLAIVEIDNNHDDDDDDNNKQRSQVNKSRYSRSIVTVDSENTSEGTSMINSDDLMKDLRVGRSRRDEARGPLFATFIGGVPEQHISDDGHIGPWVKRNESGYGFNKFHLVEDKKSIEVTANGLYMISVQIFYLGEASHFSYWILLDSEGYSNTRRLTKCSTSSTVAATEASCHTTVTVPMKRGDRFQIQQQEKNRLVNLQEGYSYIQVMLLSTDQGKKRS